MMIDAEMKGACAAAFAMLRARKEKVSFAESLTGGLIAATFVENPGASAVLDESYVTYAPESKVRILGVNRETVETVGVVSARCAREMAQGVRRVSGADWGVSATGLAGPDGGTPDLPVGTVFIGVATREKTRVIPLRLAGSRMRIRTLAMKHALHALWEEATQEENQA